jgi:hypothetical protein
VLHYTPYHKNILVSAYTECPECCLTKIIFTFQWNTNLFTASHQQKVKVSSYRTYANFWPLCSAHFIFSNNNEQSPLNPSLSWYSNLVLNGDERLASHPNHITQREWSFIFHLRGYTGFTASQDTVNEKQYLALTGNQIRLHQTQG